MGFTPRRTIAVRVFVTAVACAAMLLPVSVRANSAHSHAAAIKHGGTLIVSQGPNGSWTANFNPWAPAMTNGTGNIWEPLLWFNILKGGKITPWLARSYAWSNGNKTLTFNLRPGVKWNDGKPFTSKDVLFSFQMAKKYADFGYCTCVSEVTSVTTPNALTAQFHLKAPDSTMVFWIGNSEPLPQHVFAGKGDPAKVQVTHPVATGPFMVGSFSPQVFVLKRNPHYWQKGLPYVDALRYPAYSSNDSDQLALVNGEIDYGGVFIPDAQSVYASKSPYNHFWYSGTGAPVALWMNDAVAPFNNVHVRKAINMAIDRTQISKVAEYGYEPPSNGAVLFPGYIKKWGDSTAVKAAPSKANITAAKAELAKATGVDISKPMDINVVSGWSDWVTSVQMIATQLKAIGMNLTVQPLQFSDYLQKLQTGSFNMAISWTAGEGNSPYYLYHDDFSTIPPTYAPIGQTATANFGRFKNTALDKLINQYSKTTIASKQVSIIKQAERIVAANVPVVPIMNSANWYEYNTKKFVGWPTAKNPYDLPPPWVYGHGNGNLDVVLHVHLK
ncbi:MAG TPA: ABC transporter substrate-binding protein [Chloroflexota bacterium]